MSETLHDMVATELAEAVDPRAAALATAVAARYGGASRAVLFYGSCLREQQLDGLMLDFYLIVSDYRAAYDGGWLAFANRLIPPNVFPFAADGLTCKYAVLSEEDFTRLCGPDADNPSVWARFAQPSRLAWVADDGAREAMITAVASAGPTLIARTLPMIGAPANAGVQSGAGHRAVAFAGEQYALDLWRAAFALTYAAELRAERTTRSGSIVDSDPARYRRFTPLVLDVAGTLAPASRSHEQALQGWRRTQRRGKLLTLLRLLKASATFAGGLDYLAWKINRHAGTQIVLRPWQRRWPILGAITLLPRLLARGAVR